MNLSYQLCLVFLPSYLFLRHPFYIHLAMYMELLLTFNCSDHPVLARLHFLKAKEPLGLSFALFADFVYINQLLHSIMKSGCISDNRCSRVILAFSSNVAQHWCNPPRLQSLHCSSCKTKNVMVRTAHTRRQKRPRCPPF